MWWMGTSTGWRWCVGCLPGSRSGWIRDEHCEERVGVGLVRGALPLAVCQTYEGQIMTIASTITFGYPRRPDQVLPFSAAFLRIPLSGVFYKRGASSHRAHRQ